MCFCECVCVRVHACVCAPTYLCHLCSHVNQTELTRRPLFAYQVSLSRRRQQSSGRFSKNIANTFRELTSLIQKRRRRKVNPRVVQGGNSKRKSMALYCKRIVCAVNELATENNVPGADFSKCQNKRYLSGFSRSTFCSLLILKI